MDDHFCPTSSGPWYSKLCLFSQDTTELIMPNPDIQAEFFIDLDVAVPALRAVWEVIKGWEFGVDEVIDEDAVDIGMQVGAKGEKRADTLRICGPRNDGEREASAGRTRAPTATTAFA